MWAHWGSEQLEELRYRVAYHTYLASRGQLLYTPCAELVVGWTISETLLLRSCICWLRHAHVKEDTRLPVFPYCKRWWGLGTRLLEHVHNGYVYCLQRYSGQKVDTLGNRMGLTSYVVYDLHGLELKDLKYMFRTI